MGKPPSPVHASSAAGWRRRPWPTAATAAPATTAPCPAAALSGAPFAAFTVYGATPQPDSAIFSLEAKALIGDATKLTLRYDGDIGSGTDNHTLNVGMRFTW